MKIKRYRSTIGLDSIVISNGLTLHHDYIRWLSVLTKTASYQVYLGYEECNVEKVENQAYWTSQVRTLSLNVVELKAKWRVKM